MGLGASSVRLLSLISRQYDNNRQMLSLTRTKVTLSNEVNAAAKEYQNALSSKKMQWTTGGLKTTDLSYAVLMRPNESNMKNPVLITDSSGKIVVDTKYKKYAEMISPNGTSLGDYSGGTRTKILSELTGISEETINNAETASASRDDAATKFSKEENAFDEWLDEDNEVRKAGTKYLTVDELAQKMGSTTDGQDLAKMYKNSEDFVFLSPSSLSDFINNIKNNMIKYFINDDYIGCTDKTKFEDACNETYKLYETLINEGNLNSEVKKNEIDVVHGLVKIDAGYKVNVQDLFKMIMEKYSGTSSHKKTDANKKTYAFRDTSTSSWDSWHKELVKRYDELKAVSSEYDSTVEDANMAMTADQESMIQYYDNLFTAIADNGWVYDAEVNDNEYLNQMFQNNAYYITTMTRNECYDESLGNYPQNWKYEYDTSLASNYDNIISVNDSDAARKALAKYEAEKLKINQKETDIDTKLKNLETEQSAIKEMIESIKKIKDDNIERTFKLWS